MLSSIFNGGLVMLLFQVIHLAVAAELYGSQATTNLQIHPNMRTYLSGLLSPGLCHPMGGYSSSVRAQGPCTLSLSRYAPAPIPLSLLLLQARPARKKTTQHTEGRQTPASTQLFLFVFKLFENPSGYIYKPVMSLWL